MKKNESNDERNSAARFHARTNGGPSTQEPRQTEESRKFFGFKVRRPMETRKESVPPLQQSGKKNSTVAEF
jgi:hypothetical protein